MFGKISFKVQLGIALALFFGFIMPNHGHGDYWNPLRISLEPLSQRKHQEYTDFFLSGNIDLKGIGPPKLIHDFSEVEIAPESTGWGSDDNHALRFYKMDDELYNKLCEPLQEVKRHVHSLTNTLVVEHEYTWGSHPFGCRKHTRKWRDLTERELGSDESLFFSTFLKPEEFSRRIGKDFDFEVARVSSFYHNFTNEKLSTPSHYSMTPTIAIQCHGRKIWNFSPPRAIGKYGVRGNNGAGQLRGVDEDVPQFVVNATQGTILSFPGYWAHHVFSFPGPVGLFSLRLRDGVGLNRIKKLLGRVFLRERWGLWYGAPSRKAQDKTTYETHTKLTATDIYGEDGCLNELKEHELKKMIQMHEDAVAKAEQS